MDELFRRWPAWLPSVLEMIAFDATFADFFHAAPRTMPRRFYRRFLSATPAYGEIVASHKALAFIYQVSLHFLRFASWLRMLMMMLFSRATWWLPFLLCYPFTTTFENMILFADEEQYEKFRNYLRWLRWPAMMLSAARHIIGTAMAFR